MFAKTEGTSFKQGKQKLGLETHGVGHVSLQSVHFFTD